MNERGRLNGTILDMQSFDRQDMDADPLKNLPVDWAFHPFTRPGDTLERMQDMHVVITNKVAINREIIVQTPSLRLILIAATGTDNVDLEACREQDVTVCNVRHYATPAVVQHTIGLMLNLLTGMPDYAQAVRSGAWSRSEVFCLLDHPIIEAGGKTLGIVGYGTLGKAVGQVARALGMHVIIAQRLYGPALPGRVEFDDLVQDSDVISLHCPLTEQTRHLFSSREFSMMRPGAVIINTARGGIIDSQALISALQEGRIAGAGIDVLDLEPPPSGHPLLQAGIPNLIVTPHNAWGSCESRQRLVQMLADNFSAWHSGDPVNAV